VLIFKHVALFVYYQKLLSVAHVYNIV